MSKPTHMELAGLSPDAVAKIVERSFLAEQFVAVELGGFLRPEGDPVGDVLLPSGEIVDVKSVRRMFRFVNGGAHKPRSRVVVVEWRSEDRPVIVGVVERDQWRRGIPDYLQDHGFKGSHCWWVPASDVRPPDALHLVETVRAEETPPPRGTDEATVEVSNESDTPPARIEFGMVDPSAVKLTSAERKKQRDREADRRRRARKRNLPVPTPWTDPATAHRGLGNGGGGRPVARREDDEG